MQDAKEAAKRIETLLNGSALEKPSQEAYGHEAESRWLLSFNENLQRVRETRGFVLQIHHGVMREKSERQLAEEKQSGWLQVPRIGYFAFPSTDFRGGNPQAEEYMQDAMEAAKVQWERGVWKEVQMVSPVFQAVEGELQLNECGGVEDFARCTYPDGSFYVGQYHDSLRHGHGTMKYPDGNAYSGDYENGQMHGGGTYYHASGDIYVGFSERNERKGPGIWLEKASGSYSLMKDGQVDREITVAEAGQLAQMFLEPILFAPG